MKFLQLRRELRRSNLETASVCSLSRFDNPRVRLDCFSGGNQTLIITVCSVIEMLIYSWENSRAMFHIVPELGASKYSDPREVARVNCRTRYGEKYMKQGNAGEQLHQMLISDVQSACNTRGSYSGCFNKRHGSQGYSSPCINKELIK